MKPIVLCPSAGARRGHAAGPAGTEPRPASNRPGVGLAARMAAAVVVLLAAAAGRAAEQADAGLARLRILGDDYPRAFFFRASEGLAATGMPYERWEATFDRLMGIIGKVLEEEVPGRSRYNIEYFTRFKQRHPEQIVLLHYNGNARDPRYQTQGRYFAGHWIYYNGAAILEDVPAEEGVSEIRVDHPEWFRTNMGRYLDKNEDVGLCELSPDGKPDWRRSEQVQLISVDRRRGVLRVRRGCYGTKPRAFQAGRAYAAAHATEGPWGRRSNLMWFYNYSTRCPRDERGRTCGEAHAEELAARFAPGGQLAALDGLEFDVLTHVRRGGGAPGRGLDCDADGRPDNGIIDGVNTYGVGVLRFLADVRRRLGDQKLILADGHGEHHQRGVGLLNGIESEGWPDLRDAAVEDWSGGMNRHAYWAARGRPPAFSYVNHKFNAPSGQPGVVRRADVPMKTHRLVFAAAVLTDSAICYSYPPPPEPGEALGVWDELRMGRQGRVGWLGRPLGPPVRLALRAPDLLGGAGAPPGEQLLERLRAEGVRLQRDGAAIRAAAQDPTAERVRVTLPDAPRRGPDLVVSLTARAAPLPGYPAFMPRLAHVSISAAGELLGPDVAAGMQRRGGPIEPLDPDSGAAVQFVAGVELAGRRLPAMRAHPPYRNGVGMVFWEREARVPDGAVLEFCTGMGERAPGRSDGVVFAVDVAEVRDGRPGAFRRVFSENQVAAEWVRRRTPLAEWSGRRVRLRFVADAGPNDNATTDHAYWGAVRIRRPGGTGKQTRVQRFMTWLDERPFTSYFYFSGVGDEPVDVTLTVEGAAPVWIERLTAHAAPDLMYREFEHGLVLANPSPRPAVFPLARLLPGRRYRRLQGSSRQDPEANNGQPAGPAVRLEGKEGLFLVRER